MEVWDGLLSGRSVVQGVEWHSIPLWVDVEVFPLSLIWTRSLPNPSDLTPSYRLGGDMAQSDESGKIPTLTQRRLLCRSTPRTTDPPDNKPTACLSFSPLITLNNISVSHTHTSLKYSQPTHLTINTIHNQSFQFSTRIRSDIQNLETF